MSTIRIEILNPKARRLLKSLVELNLISIKDDKSGFYDLIKKIRSKNLTKPTLDEITEEVEAVRSRRYAQKKK